MNKTIYLLLAVFSFFFVSISADEMRTIGNMKIDYTTKPIDFIDGEFVWPGNPRAFQEQYFQWYSWLVPDTIAKVKKNIPMVYVHVLLPFGYWAEEVSYKVTEVVQIADHVVLKDTKKDMGDLYRSTIWPLDTILKQPYYESEVYYEWLGKKESFNGLIFGLFHEANLLCRPFRYDTVSQNLYAVCFDVELSIKPTTKRSLMEELYLTNPESADYSFSEYMWPTYELINKEFFDSWYPRNGFNSIMSETVDFNTILGHTGQGFHLRIDEGVKDARLEVRDVQGRTVKETVLTMRGEVLTATTGTPLPRGTYVCTLVTDGRVADTKKIQVK